MTPLPTGGRMIEGNGMIKAFKLTFTITNRITAGLTRIERARQSDHPGFRGLMPQSQPSVSATRPESDGGPGSDRP